MLPPYEIKAKDFTHVLRGYAVEEVDEYCSFALEKYTELYRENDALQAKIASLESELAHFREDEESIRSALVDAKRASTKIVEEATERSKVILHSAKLNCDRILSEFRSAVSEERDELLLLRAMVKKFKDDLFTTYKTHIEYIERIAPELDSLDESEFSDEAVLRLAVESIKDSIRKDESTADGTVPTPLTEAGASPETDNAAEEDGKANPDGRASAAREAAAASAESNRKDAEAEAMAEDKAAGAENISDTGGTGASERSEAAVPSASVSEQSDADAHVASFEQTSLFSDEEELILDRRELGGSFDPEEQNDDGDFLAFPEEEGDAYGGEDAIGRLIGDIKNGSGG